MPLSDEELDLPPPPEPGWVVGAPDFVGLGVQKAATSWWYDVICAHPRVSPLRGTYKELHFFDRYWARPFDDRDVELYHRWFARPPGQMCGEWTPRYLHDWWVPPLVARAAPQAALLVMLRDPVDRFVSGVAHELRSRGRRLDPAIAGDALRRSCYADQLEQLFRVVDPTRVLVLQQEVVVNDPARWADRTFEHLGLDPHPVGVDVLGRRVNVTEDDKPMLPEGVAAELRARLAPDLDRLAELVPSVDLDRWVG